MTMQMLAYPFLFIAIFFEAFILVTFLSKPAREARRRTPGTATPTVAIIVPCYNEAATIAGTCDSLLALDYPRDKLEILLVDDGSTDATPIVMKRFAGNPQITIIRKENGGKYTALNAGIAATGAEIVGCLDADSLVEPDALRESVSCFTSPRVAAVTPAMSVHQPKNLLQHMQNAEYIFGITLKHALSTVHGIHVTPGPFSLYRRNIVLELGGFKHGHQTEDLEMALRIQQAGFVIENAPRARVYTKAPLTLWKLVRQRTRWTSGYMRNVLNEYRSMIGNYRYGALGLLVLPIGIVMIGGGVVLFFVLILKFVQTIMNAIALRVGIPLSYSLLPHTGFGWFYLPVTVYFFLIVTAVIASLGMIALGKNLSKTPGSLALGLLSYALLYSFVAPLWLIRATADVALGKKRLWR